MKYAIKKCSKCNTEKPVASFYNDRSRKDGLCCQCKDCMSETKELYLKNHKDKVADTQRRHRIKTKEKIASRMRQYHKDNAVRISEYSKKYYQTERGIETRRRGKYRRRAIMACVEVEDFNPSEVLERDGYVCQLCGRKTRPDFKNPYHSLYPNLDHIVPISAGGGHTRLNTQCLCHRCNCQKHNSGVGDQLRIFG
jgi:5-methylcytosine-specific restriction endonuclease McrA